MLLARSSVASIALLDVCCALLAKLSNVFLQVFVGKIPRDLFEDTLVPLFEKAGPIWDLRLMMDPLTGLNRGYAFLTYCNKDAALEAVKLVCLAVSLLLLFFFPPIPSAWLYNLSIAEQAEWRIPCHL